MGYKYNIIYNANGKTHKTHHSETVDFEINEEVNGDVLELTLVPKTDISFESKTTFHFLTKASFL